MTPQDAKKVSDLIKERWKVINGVISCDPRVWPKGFKHLVTQKSYDDFVLQIEWRIKATKGPLFEMPIILPDGSYKLDEEGTLVTLALPNADSGIFLRWNPKVKVNAQVQIWCWPIGSGDLTGFHKEENNMPPEIRAANTAKLRADNPIGQWNRFVITLVDEHVTVVLNGKTVIENAPLPGIAKRGPFMLQHHGGYDDKKGTWDSASSLVQYRNIYIKELSHGEKK